MNGYWPLQQSLQQSLTVAVDSESESQKEVQNLETIGVPFQDELFVPTKQRSQRNRDANSEQNISNALVYKFKDTSAAGGSRRSQYWTSKKGEFFYNWPSC